jgi:hypothetical protein
MRGVRIPLAPLNLRNPVRLSRTPRQEHKPSWLFSCSRRVVRAPQAAQKDALTWPTPTLGRFLTARAGPTCNLVSLFDAGLSGAISERQLTGQVEPRQAVMVGQPLVGIVVAEHVVRHGRSAADGGHDHVPVEGLRAWVDLWPALSLICWIGTPLLLMIETAVWQPSWACRWPMPVLLVIVEKRQLTRVVNMVPFSTPARTVTQPPCEPSSESGRSASPLASSGYHADPMLMRSPLPSEPTATHWRLFVQAIPWSPYASF